EPENPTTAAPETTDRTEEGSTSTTQLNNPSIAWGHAKDNLKPRHRAEHSRRTPRPKQPAREPGRKQKHTNGLRRRHPPPGDTRNPAAANRKAEAPAAAKPPPATQLAD
ncbi:hypothetical protein, partial [Trichocoleus sp. FACHB-40]|uniref:hypothetical protein n=1 Tax=Funiculus sociatus TaxID=450527 RepID=UPI0018F04D77